MQSILAQFLLQFPKTEYIKAGKKIHDSLRPRQQEIHIQRPLCYVSSFLYIEGKEDGNCISFSSLSSEREFPSKFNGNMKAGTWQPCRNKVFVKTLLKEIPLTLGRTSTGNYFSGQSHRSERERVWLGVPNPPTQENNRLPHLVEPEEEYFSLTHLNLSMKSR